MEADSSPASSPSKSSKRRQRKRKTSPKNFEFSENDRKDAERLYKKLCVAKDMLSNQKVCKEEKAVALLFTLEALSLQTKFRDSTRPQGKHALIRIISGSIVQQVQFIRNLLIHRSLPNVEEPQASNTKNEKNESKNSPEPKGHKLTSNRKTNVEYSIWTPSDLVNVFKATIPHLLKFLNLLCPEIKAVLERTSATSEHDHTLKEQAAKVKSSLEEVKKEVRRKHESRAEGIDKEKFQKKFSSYLEKFLSNSWNLTNFMDTYFHIVCNVYPLLTMFPLWSTQGEEKNRLEALRKEWLHEFEKYADPESTAHLKMEVLFYIRDIKFVIATQSFAVNSMPVIRSAVVNSSFPLSSIMKGHSLQQYARQVEHLVPPSVSYIPDPSKLILKDGDKILTWYSIRFLILFAGIEQVANRFSLLHTDSTIKPMENVNATHLEHSDEAIVLETKDDNTAENMDYRKIRFLFNECIHKAAFCEQDAEIWGLIDGCMTMYKVSNEILDFEAGEIEENCWVKNGKRMAKTLLHFVQSIERSVCKPEDVVLAYRKKQGRLFQEDQTKMVAESLDRMSRLKQTKIFTLDNTICVNLDTVVCAALLLLYSKGQDGGSGTSYYEMLLRSPTVQLYLGWERVKFSVSDFGILAADASWSLFCYRYILHNSTTVQDMMQRKSAVLSMFKNILKLPRFAEMILETVKPKFVKKEGVHKVVFKELIQALGEKAKQVITSTQYCRMSELDILFSNDAFRNMLLDRFLGVLPTSVKCYVLRSLYRVYFKAMYTTTSFSELESVVQNTLNIFPMLDAKDVETQTLNFEIFRMETLLEVNIKFKQKAINAMASASFDKQQQSYIRSDLVKEACKLFEDRNKALKCTGKFQQAAKAFLTRAKVGRIWWIRNISTITPERKVVVINKGESSGEWCQEIKQCVEDIYQYLGLNCRPGTMQPEIYNNSIRNSEKYQTLLYLSTKYLNITKLMLDHAVWAPRENEYYLNCLEVFIKKMCASEPVDLLQWRRGHCTTLTILARHYKRKLDYKKALYMYEQSLEIRRVDFDENHAAILSLENEIGQLKAEIMPEEQNIGLVKNEEHATEDTLFDDLKFRTA